LNLFIVESPNKCKKIKGFLGNDFIVEASYGHIKKIPEKKMNVDLNTFEPVYAVEKGKAEVVKKLKAVAEKAKVIYLATDPDREGEAIAAHVYSIFGATDKKKCVRVTFHEITKKAVQDAIKSPRSIDDNLVQAQKARQVLDRVIGYTASPLVWRIASKTSAGRVQSVALRMICERQKEIDAFIPENYWYLDVDLKAEKGPLTARVNTKEKDNRYKDEAGARNDQKELKTAKYELIGIERKDKRVNPYPPFDTASLQGAASALFDWSATKTMAIAQELYETGAVTYIRSDSYSIAKEALDEVREFIGTKYPGELPDKPNIYTKKSSAAAQEGHECIRPVHVNPDVDVSGDAKRLYDLIYSRFVACQMGPMVMDTVTYTIKTDTGHTLTSHGQIIKDEGWYKAYPYAKTTEKSLPDAAEGEILAYLRDEISKHTTQPPAKFNDGTLIKNMESLGVGRPSTRASILKSIQDKGYVVRDKSFTPTSLGMRINDFLVPGFSDSFLDYKYTAGLEEDLDLIADGKKPYYESVKSVYDALKMKIEAAKKSIPKKPVISMGVPCPKCKKGEVVERESRFGKFFSCSLWPKCKAILVQEDGKYIVKVKKAVEHTDEKCPECGGFLSVRTNHKKGTQFLGCTSYPKCKYTKNME